VPRRIIFARHRVLSYASNGGEGMTRRPAADRCGRPTVGGSRICPQSTPRRMSRSVAGGY